MKKFNIYNETDKKLTKEMFYMKRILKHVLKHENLKKVYFNFIIVDNDYIHKLNNDYRKIDRETDVITFALEDYKHEKEDDFRVLGDIYVSIDKAITQANDYGHSLVRELCFLSVHGLLHLLGYDHMNKEDEKVMFTKQEMILDGCKFARRSTKKENL